LEADPNALPVDPKAQCPLQVSQPSASSNWVSGLLFLAQKEAWHLETGPGLRVLQPVGRTQAERQSLCPGPQSLWDTDAISISGMQGHGCLSLKGSNPPGSLNMHTVLVFKLDPTWPHLQIHLLPIHSYTSFLINPHNHCRKLFLMTLFSAEEVEAPPIAEAISYFQGHSS
jgi:hypothetical protein